MLRQHFDIKKIGYKFTSHFSITAPASGKLEVFVLKKIKIVAQEIAYNYGTLVPI